MAKVVLICSYCGCSFLREKREHRRSQKLKRNNFCCQSHQISFRNKISPNINTKHLRIGSSKDEYSPFRVIMSSIKRRHPETDITIEYLREVLDKQGGICPFTGKKMVAKEWLSKEDGWGKTVPFQISIDRIDCSKGYVQGNVRFVSLIANYARSNWNDEMVIQFCRDVVFYHGATEDGQ